MLSLCLSLSLFQVYSFFRDNDKFKVVEKCLLFRRSYHGGRRHLSFAENSGARVPVIGSRLLASGAVRRQPVHFAVTNAAKVGREGRGHSLLIWTAGRVTLVVIQCVLDVCLRLPVC